MKIVFQQLNSQLFQNVHCALQDELAGANIRNDKKFLNYSDCDEFRIKRPFLFAEKEFRELIQAADHIRDAQIAIARKIYDQVGLNRMLDRFGVNREIEPFIQLDDLFDKTRMIGRFDVIPGREGYKFCELNVDSPLCCSEDFEFMEEYRRAIGIAGVAGVGSPFDDTLELIRSRCGSEKLGKLVILDHSKYKAENGYFPTSFNLKKIDEKFRGLDVEILTENEFREYRLKNNCTESLTVVFRLFIYEDIEGEVGTLGAIFQDSDIFINSFVSEILTSKVWFSELWDPENLKVLDEEQCRSIKKYIPYTTKVNTHNLDYLLREKDSLVFKEVQSNSGKGVYLGKELTEEKLAKKLDEMDCSKLVVQQLVEHDPVSIPNDKGCNELYSVVLGLHFSADKYSGMLVRAGTNSGVINVGSGAGGSSWAIVVDQKEVDQIFDVTH